MNKLANSLIIGIKKIVILLEVLRINLGTTFDHKINYRGNNNHYYKQFLWQNI